jgi:hypothetical protein
MATKVAKGTKMPMKGMPMKTMTEGGGGARKPNQFRGYARGYTPGDARKRQPAPRRSK